MTVSVREALEGALKSASYAGREADGDHRDPASFERELEARGFAVVPIEPTAKMFRVLACEVMDGSGTEHGLRAAIAARPRVDETEGRA